jgi:hypothetical protein
MRHHALYGGSTYSVVRIVIYLVQTYRLRSFLVDLFVPKIKQRKRERVSHPSLADAADHGGAWLLLFPVRL